MKTQTKIKTKMLFFFAFFIDFFLFLYLNLPMATLQSCSYFGTLQCSGTGPINHK